jgi:hypothetical protein
MTDRDSHFARCAARQKELLKADDLIMAAMAALVHVESDQVFLALRQARREVTLALNNVEYDSTHPPVVDGS